MYNATQIKSKTTKTSPLTRHMIKTVGASALAGPAAPATFQKHKFKRKTARGSDNITKAPMDFTRQLL